MTARWLAIRLEAPLMAFGGVAIDQIGPVREFPAASMLTGLIGNALGYHWSDGAAHEALQDRIVFGARLERAENALVTDSQNVQLARSDKGWTTTGEPEGRAGRDSTYRAPHRRFRDYHADFSVRVVLRLRPADAKPTLDAVADALDRPARPLYLGRKPCLPSCPMLAADAERWVIGDSVHDALCALPGSATSLAATWPVGEGPEAGQGVDRITDLADLRNWRSGLHAGSRRVVEGRVMLVTPDA